MSVNTGVVTNAYAVQIEIFPYLHFHASPAIMILVKDSQS